MRISYLLPVFFVALVGTLFLFLQQKQFGQKATTLPQTISPTPTLVQATYEIKNNSQVINGMKIYTNKEYSYSFSYPSDWQVLDEPNVQGIEIQKIDNNGIGFSISIRINDNPKKLSLKEYAKSQAETLPNGGVDVPQKIMVNNKEGYKLQQLPLGLTTTIYLPYTTDKVIYIFAGGTFNKSQEKLYTQIVANFINSLKF